MSVIKSSSKERLISATPELAGQMANHHKDDKTPHNDGNSEHSYQKLVKKVADILVQKNIVKTKNPLSSSAKVQEKTLNCSQLTGVLEGSSAALHFPAEVMPHTMPVVVPFVGDVSLSHVTEPLQSELPLEFTDEALVGDIQEIPMDDELFDEDIPLLNMGGAPMVIIPHKEVIQQRNSLLNTSTSMAGNQQEQPIASEFENDNMIESPLQNKVSQHSVSTPKMVEQEFKQIEKPDAEVNVNQVSENLPESVMSTDHFMQNLTKNEKRPSTLHESSNNVDDMIVRNGLASSEVGTLLSSQSQAQEQPVSLTKDLSAVVRHIEQGIEHNDLNYRFQYSHNLPKTLTYTFQKWNNSPSVTFELATKTELIASTSSGEMQSALQDNKHLLGSEKHIYFRQEQEERRQQQGQQQEQEQQEED